MYLRRLRVESFRSCDSTDVFFEEDLTILAGENNAGKTNVLDAIRLVTSSSDGRRTRVPGIEDVRRGSADGFKIEAVFDGLTDEQRGAFIGGLKSPTSTTAHYGLTYTLPREQERRGSVMRWAGPRQGADPEPDARELIRHVHLPALRDATRELASSSPGRIDFLLRHTSNKEQQSDLIGTARQSFGKLASHPAIKNAETLIRGGFSLLTAGVQPQEAHLSFADPTLTALARDLRIRLALQGFDPTDLSESGLGYANLLYLASVLVELRAAKDGELTLFLVEEPEAHLHPQLQMVTLEYLRDQARESKKELRDPGQHDGRIQVVVTTHSPNLTASVPSKHIVILRTSVPRSDSRAPEQGATDRERTAVSPSDVDGTINQTDAAGGVELQVRGGANPPVTQAVAISRLGLSPGTLGKIDRYLDVTRSALLFSKRVLLVEGISEALLVPVFGKIMFGGGKNSGAFARFRASTVIAIDGVDFEPYVELLLTASPEGSMRIADRVIIVTDEDAGTSGEGRPVRLRETARQLNAYECLGIYQSPGTFEATLFQRATESALKETFLSLRPESEEKWKMSLAGRPDNARPRAFVELLKDSKVRKGDFAQILAPKLESIGDAAVPDRFRHALYDLVGEKL